MEIFYPSISSNLFKESIDFPKQSIQISNNDLSIIIQPTETLRFESTTKGIKRNRLMHKDIGLYHNCFSIFKKILRPAMKKKKKAIVKVFKKCRISIKADTNLKTVNFVNVTFDHDKNIYKPYQKLDNSPNKNSNHSTPFKHFKTAVLINCQMYTKNI